MSEIISLSLCSVTSRTPFESSLFISPEIIWISLSDLTDLVRWIMPSAECGVRSAECGVWKTWSVENAECGKCGVWKMRSVENVECGKCGVWKTELLYFNSIVSSLHFHGEIEQFLLVALKNSNE